MFNFIILDVASPVYVGLMLIGVIVALAAVVGLIILAVYLIKKALRKKKQDKLQKDEMEGNNND